MGYPWLPRMRQFNRPQPALNLRHSPSGPPHRPIRSVRDQPESRPDLLNSASWAPCPRSSQLTPAMPLFSCGSNSDGQLSYGPSHTTDSPRFLPTSSALPGTPLALAFGARHTLLILAPPSFSAMTPPNELWVCGSNFERQLGPVLPGETREAPVTQLRRLPLEALGVAEVAEVGWEPVQVAACSETSLVVCRWRGGEEERDDVLIVMGNDDWGERAGAGKPADGPRAISFASFRSPSSNTTLAASMRITHLAAGPRHALALLEWTAPGHAPSRRVRWRTLVGWGAARHGQLGASLVDARGRALAKVPVPTEVTDGEGGFLRSGADVLGLALGMEHSAVLVRRLLSRAGGFAGAGRGGEAEVNMLGSGRKGQLGPDGLAHSNRLRLPLADNALAASSELVRHQLGACWSTTFVLSTTPSASAHVLSAFGSNHHSQLAQPSATLLSTASPQPVQLPPPPPGSTREVRQLAAGSEHVLLHCRVTTEEDAEQDEVWAWGWNEHGNLGTGDLNDGQAPQKVWPPPGQAANRVTGVWAGNATSWIATA